MITRIICNWCHEELRITGEDSGLGENEHKIFVDPHNCEEQTISLNKLANRIKSWRQSKEFHTPSTIKGHDVDMMLGKLMLVTTEVSEAAEAARDHDMGNFREELADIIIRVLDIAAATQTDIEHCIDAKMRYNEQRPKGHGRKTKL